MLQTLGQGVGDMLNARGRRPLHVMEGLAICLGAVTVSAALAARNAPSQEHPGRRLQEAMLDKPDFAPDQQDAAAIWAPLFLVLSLSGIRVWNSPASPSRSRALGLWAGIQGLHAVWALLGPRRQTAQMVVAVATLGGGLAYLNEARKVDSTSAALVSPYVGWMSIANVIKGEVWRRNKDNPTIH
jgi:tryptophan-rich sensory protein